MILVIFISGFHKIDVNRDILIKLLIILEFFVTGFAFDSFYDFVEDAGILNPLLIHAGSEY